LEESLDGLTGKKYPKQCIKLSKLYAESGDYNRAYDVAIMGATQSRQNNFKDYEAICLNQAAKVLIDKPRATQADFEKAKVDLSKARDALFDQGLNKLEMDNSILQKRLERNLELLLNPNAQKTGLEELKDGITDLFSKDKSDSEPNSSSMNEPRTQTDRDYLLKQLQLQKMAIARMSSEQLQQEYLLLSQNRLLDSMNLAAFVDSMEMDRSRMLLDQQNLELREKETELKLEKGRKRIFMALSGMIVLIALGLLFLFFNTRKFNRTLKVKNDQIAHEKKKADDLLLNILPAEIAAELKETGKSQARHFGNASIMFTDFKDFTTASEVLSANDLVEELNICFKAFDEIITRNKVEKIKTIGDAYMAVGGLDDGENMIKNVVVAGIEMQDFMKSRRQDNPNSFEMRVGIHKGPVVAGIVGVKKFQYDIWGDSVNTAARMESSGEVGKVNVSGDVYEALKEHGDLIFTSRGKIEAKNKGQIEMYFVTRA
jgi:class 3 adenylate cyclase